MVQSPSRADVQAVFLALSHESRRHIVMMLSHGGGELPSGYLAGRFKHSWPTTTRHLKVLEDAGVVEVRREGRSAMYRLRPERIERVVAGWIRHLTPVKPVRTWASSGPKTAAALAAPSALARPAHRSKARHKSLRQQGAPAP
jgi:DNA-binding transcriptional ArsR family regulator